MKVILKWEILSQNLTLFSNYYILMLQNILATFPWLRLLLSVIIAQIIGAIWYGPLFSKCYIKENGFTEESMKWGKSMRILMFQEIVSTIVLFLWLGVLLQYVWMDHKWEIWLMYFFWILSTNWSMVIWWMNKTWRSRCMGAGKVLITLAISLYIYWLV